MQFLVKDILNNKNLHQVFVQTTFFWFSCRHADYNV